MNKDFWKTLYCWLETASLEEITVKQQLVQHMLGESNDLGLKTDIRRILRLMDEEFVARAEVANVSRLSMAR
ncbi:hypothetical protein [Methylobacter sp. S3L5C]|uniref:hypothetical protein n=1 Tax=Methylobacter sp. S3L5C TaxID=2839024 RepID=UPI001FAD49DD|nr:hypothetical protein [Methylobacter sp. S3L5C]UOA07342.1 hypothetical protein KKZ03_13770 [Methylobacter sp. S3L5C]